jgi:HK97 family phage major capsid protein
MEIKEMNLADTEARMSELDSLVETSENPEEIEGYTEELRSLKEHKAELEALEERKANAKALEEDRAEDTVKEIETRKEIETMKTIEEYRNSEEYVNAFAEYIKTGDAEELRALLTTNVGAAGEVAVPDMVYDIIKTDWAKTSVMSLVKKISVQGNMKVQFELSAGDAVIHNEGSGAVSEEELTLGVVTLIPESIKKWISVSDEVLDMKGAAFLQYVYDELTYKIAQKCESVLIGKIKALPTSASENKVCAKKVKAGAALGTIATALGQLNADATNPVVVMNPATKAAFKAAVYAGNFNADPFEGLQVITTNQLPAIGDASENDVYAIVGDFGFGALANFPNGDAITIKLDDKTDMTKDLVRILGREYVAVEPIACRAFVNITAPASA